MFSVQNISVNDFGFRQVFVSAGRSMMETMKKFVPTFCNDFQRPVNNKGSAVFENAMLTSWDPFLTASFRARSERDA